MGARRARAALIVMVERLGAGRKGKRARSTPNGVTVIARPGGVNGRVASARNRLVAQIASARLNANRSRRRQSGERACLAVTSEPQLDTTSGWRSTNAPSSPYEVA